MTIVSQKRQKYKKKSPFFLPFFHQKIDIDTPGIVCIILNILLRDIYSLYIIYERVQNTP